MERGLVFNIQRYSVQDGPGIRTAVFLKGCPLRCAWCHNPEGISDTREVYLVETLCAECGECRRVCPRQAEVTAASQSGSPLPARVAGCDLCGACVEACPTGARRMAGEEMTVDQVLTTVLRDRVFFEDSGGGVTFTGGEPLRQAAFLLALLRACREQGLHTAVDTCGLARLEDLLEAARFTDLFLYDLKLMNERAHEQHTGAPNRLILENLSRLGLVHSNIWVRVPFVPGVNDSLSDLRAAAKYAASIPGVRQVNLLPYHRIGTQKHQRLGRQGPGGEYRAPGTEAIADAIRVFEEEGLAARAGG